MKTGSYEALDPGGGTAMVLPESKDLLKRVDAVVFDCDGTIIDSRESYDVTIMRTVRLMIEKFSALRLPMEEAGGEMILKIRRTGGFNSDWDTTYALSILSEVAIAQSRMRGKASASRVLARLRDLVEDFASRKRLAGRRSLDLYLLRAGLNSDELDRFRDFLGFQGDPRLSLMATTFDQIYFGGRLFQKIYGVRPTVWHDEGLIQRETLFINGEDVASFKRIIGGSRLAIATGRPFAAVEYTMGRLLRNFKRDASVFIGDGDIYPQRASELAKYRKPSGASLLRAREMLSANVMLYIGDSAEDRLMVDDARKSYRNILFGGICGSSFDEESQISYFAGTRSDLIVRSLNQVPPVLEMIRK